MDERKRTVLRRILILAAVLFCVVATDILCYRHPPAGALCVCLPLGMHLLFLVCFTDRRSGLALNLLKTAYIVFSLIYNGFYSITCVFLILFDGITRKERKDGPDGK